jgi:prepilin-type N-terminal cleavage/methylation domain-containing protein
MPLNKFKKAFSLIELSIVVLVVGVLIAGTIRSALMVAKFKVAKAITQSSPVNLICFFIAKI